MKQLADAVNAGKGQLAMNKVMESDAAPPASAAAQGQAEATQEQAPPAGPVATDAGAASESSADTKPDENAPTGG